MTTEVNGTIEIVWENGTDQFCITRTKHLTALEQKCGAGFLAILNRLKSGDAYVADIRETIRIGLMGGGKPPEDAERICRQWVDDMPKGRLVMMAVAILGAAVVGVPGDNANDKKKETTTAEGETSSTVPGESENQRFMDSVLQ